MDEGHRCCKHKFNRVLADDGKRTGIRHESRRHHTDENEKAHRLAIFHGCTNHALKELADFFHDHPSNTHRNGQLESADAGDRTEPFHPNISITEAAIITT